MGSIDVSPVVAGSIRLWIVEDGVRVDRQPSFEAVSVMDNVNRNFGDEDPIEIPDPNKFRSHIKVGTVPGTVERATFSINSRYLLDLSKWIRLSRRQCRLDVYALVGDCKNPQDFDAGWEKILFQRDGDISSHALDNTAALGSDDENPTGDNVDLTSEEYYEFGKESFARLATDDDAREILTVDVCDTEACGDCDNPSDGCQRVLATMAGTGATPGTTPVLLYSGDNGATWNTENISTLFSSESVADAECIGGNLVLVSNEGDELHFRNMDDLFQGTGDWNQADSGFVIGGGPNALDSVDATHTWIVGDGGFIYFTANPTNGVTVQDAGVATSADLQDVSAFNTKHVLAVGDLNAVVFTNNGGETWNSRTGPDVGIQLTTCWMWNETTWLIGTTEGTLWYTVDGGFTWVEHPSAIFNSVTDIDSIEFVDEVEGYMAVQFGTGAARILRTITGGAIWTELPDGANPPIQDADRINDLAVCETGSNTVFGGGLDDDGTTGFLTKAEA